MRGNRGNNGNRGGSRGRQFQPPVNGGGPLVPPPVPAARGRGAARRGRGGRGGRGGGRGGGAAGAPPPQGPPNGPAAGGPGPIPDPAVVPGPVPAAFPPTRDQVINRWVTSYRPKVARPFLDEARAAFPGVEFLVDDPGVNGVNPHELLAVGRIMATVQAIAELAHAHTGLDQQHIDFLWGAHRDLTVLGTLNNQLVAANYDPIEGHLLGEQVLAADQHRRPVLPEGPHNPYGLMVNVYCHGQAALEVTPMWVGALGYKHLAWVGHRFDDMYGVLLTAHWLRVPTSNGPQIRWYSDAINAEYPPHPPCDLMHTAGAAAGVQWHTVKVVHCWDIRGASRQQKAIYDVVMLSHRLAREDSLCALRETRQIVVEIDIPDLNRALAWARASCPTMFVPAAQWLIQQLYNNAANWCPTTKVMLQKGDFHSAVRFMSNKGRQQYSFRALQTEVDRLLTDPATHADFIYLESKAPDYFLNYRWNLTLAAFTYQAEDQAMQLRGVQAIYGPAFDAANRAVKGLDAPAEPAAGTMSYWIAGLVVAWLAIPRVRFLRVALDHVVRGVASVCWQIVRPSPMAGSFTSGLVATLAARRDHLAAVIVASPTVAEARQAAEDVRDLATACARAAVAEIKEQPPAVWEGAFTLVILAPLFEEGYKNVAKRYGRVPWVIACAVAASDDHVRNGGTALTWFMRFGLHMWFSSHPYRTAVRMHMGYNFGVLASRILATQFEPLPAAQGEWAWALGAVAVLWWLWGRRRAPTRSPVQDFDERWYAHPGDAQNRMEVLLPDDTVAIRPIPPPNRYVPPFTAAGLTTPAKDLTVRVVSVPTPFSGPIDNVGGGYYRLWGHNAPMFRPAANITNLQAVIDHRLTVAIANQAQVATWWQIHALTAGVFWGQSHHDWDLPVAWPPVNELRDMAAWPRIPRYEDNGRSIHHLDRPGMIAAWLEHTDPAKRERYRDALSVVEHCPLAANSKKVVNVQINVKKDEVLLKYRLQANDNGAIPRPIHNVDPMLAVSIGPDVYAASATIKRAWSWKNDLAQDAWQSLGRKITLTYGAGLLADELNEWFEFATRVPGWHILVAGDDSVVIRLQAGRLTIVEGDISKCDHSIRLLALAYEYNVLLAGGMDPRVIPFLLANSGATCVAGLRMADGGSVRIQRSAERNTGGVDTTVGNTVVTGGIHLLACATCDDDATDEIEHHFIQTFARAGLALKAKVWAGNLGDLGTSYYGPSFLKGYWYPTAGYPRWQWGPLPSRMLKISKIMTDPRRVYRNPGERDVPYATAAARHLASLHAGLKPYVWPAELLDWLHARADPAWSGDVAIEEWAGPWRPAAPAEPSPVLPSWRAQAAWWYGVDEDVVEDWLSHIQRLQLLEFSWHPFWAKMAIRDYN